MVRRLIAALVLGLLLFVLASLIEALVASGTGGHLWWILLLALAVALFIALRAPTARKAYGHLFFLNAAFGVGLALAGLLPRASIAQEDFYPEIVGRAAARYVAVAAFSGYLGIFAICLAVILIASSFLLLRHHRR